MATLTGTKFQSLVEAVHEKKHNFASDAIKFYLTNVAPNAATHTVKADIAEIATGNGYTGPQAVTVSSSSQTGGTYTLAVSVDVTITATGAVGPYRYAVVYNDTATNDELVAYHDFGSAINLSSGDLHRIQFNTNLITAS